MTVESGGAKEARSSSAAGTVKEAVAAMLNGSGLCVRELDHELVVTNPANPDAGQVHVAYADGYVSWERVAWSYWGTLEGFEPEDPSATVSGAEIIGALAPRADVSTGPASS